MVMDFARVEYTAIAAVRDTRQAWEGHENHSSDDTLTAADANKIHTNHDAGGTITLTLPDPAVEGMVFGFAVGVTQQLRIDPQGKTIRDNSGQTVDKYKWADAVGECLVLMGDDDGDWITIAKNGTWSEQA